MSSAKTSIAFGRSSQPDENSTIRLDEAKQ
ncbi:hypothetical protein W823_09210 [Williamsia sp. D3]|nr:hypothetical protein W823_09210 [Williamsia sp. D3]